MHSPKQDSFQNDILVTPSPSFPYNQVRDFAKKAYGLSGKLSPLDSERDQNFRIRAKTEDQFVLKIANSSEDLAVIDMQIKALEHIASVDPELPVPKVLRSKNGLAIEQIQAENGTKYYVRILSYMKGVEPQYNPTNQALFRPIGTCLARLALALRDFSYPIDNYELLWDLKHTPELRQYLPHITEPNRHKLVSYFLDRFDQNVLHLIPNLRAQIVHNDLTPDNFLVAEDDPGHIVGIIDFGDMTHTLLIIDLATTIAQMLFGHAEPVGVAVEIITAYHQVIPLEDNELRVLYDLIAARLTMLNMVAYWRVTIHPENRDYITGGVNQTWSALEAWRALDPEVVTKKFLRACAF